MSNQFDDRPKLSNEDYRMHVQILQQIIRQKSVSVYFFTVLNLALVSILIIFLPQAYSTRSGSFSYGITYNLSKLFSILLVTATGVMISAYWRAELREYRLIIETRFRSLMDVESLIFGGGPFQTEWHELGNYAGRQSAVFYVPLSHKLPLFFVVIYFAIALHKVVPL